MDVTAVRAVADELGIAGDRLTSVVTEVESALQTAWWQGGDADAFRSSWSSRQRATLQDVGSRLRDVRGRLVRQAQEQEITSGVDVWSPTTLPAALPAANLFGPLDDLGGHLVELGEDAWQGLQWLAGPEGPSFEDATRLIPGLQEALGDAMDALMRHGGPVADAITRLFGFQYVPGQDFYTTNEGSLQSHLGFHDVYDMLHKLGGMDLDDEVVEFSANGVEYRLELWRGGYGSGGAYGGEIGLYTRRPGEDGVRGLLELFPGYYSSARGDDQIRMTQTIYDTRTGEVYFTNDGQGTTDGEHYWNLAIRTDPSIPHEHLGQRGTLHVEDPAVRDAMLTQMAAQGLDPVVNADGSVSYTWEG